MARRRKEPPRYGPTAFAVVFSSIVGLGAYAILAAAIFGDSLLACIGGALIIMGALALILVVP